MCWFLVLILLLCSLSFAKNEISVAYSEQTLRLSGRTFQFAFSTAMGTLMDITLVMDRPTRIYAYGDDGFDLLLDGNPVSPTAVLVNGQPLDSFQAKPTEFEENVEVVFEYGEYWKKFVIVYGPYYEVYFQVGGAVPANLAVSLPRLSDFRPYENMDRVNEDGTVFTTYYEKTKALGIWVLQAGQTSFPLDGSSRANTLQVPSGGLTLHGYVGPAKKITFFKTVFPDQYVWLSRTINGYPKASSWYDPIFYLLVSLLDWLFRITGNYGWALILYTLIVKLVLYPLTRSQTKSMVARRQVEGLPEYKKIMQIQDKQKRQQELMNFYKEKKINVAGGCLPMLIQLPIFFMLFAVIRYESELFAFGPKFLFWEDLSIGGFQQNILIVLLSLVINFFNTLITSADEKAAKTGMIMTGVLPFLFITLPTGLQIYWVISSLVQLLITFYIYEKYHIKGITVRQFFASFKNPQEATKNEVP